MKILQINKYFYAKGGSDRIFFNTSRLLEKKSHQVIFFSMKDQNNIHSEYEKYFVSNIDYNDTSFKNIFKASFNLLYSLEAKRNMRKLINETHPDIAHIHSIYHQISPSILMELKKAGIPMVATLHDYKMVCAAYSMLSGGEICESCGKGKYYRCALKKCVKNSEMKSILCALEMYLHHSILHIYDNIDVFISPSFFLKSKLEEMGFDKKIEYLCNFVNIDEYMPRYDWDEKSIVYFGRISKEKGLLTLVKAMGGCPDLNLKIIGEGPLRQSLESIVKYESIKNVEFLGYKDSDSLKEIIRKSMFAVIPSEWYENSPCSVMEAFALGKPVVGSRLGGIPELIKDGETGMTFEPCNIHSLQDTIMSLANNPDLIYSMGKNARAFAETNLNAENYYTGLMRIYNGLYDKK